LREQAVAAEEMRRSVALAATHGMGIATDTDNVATAVDMSSSNIKHTRQLSDRLAGIAATLEANVAQFTT
jgi:hypothetical protein